MVPSRMPVLLTCVLLYAGCAGPDGMRDRVPPPDRGSSTYGPDVVVLSIVGTNDLHGHIDRLPVFSGHVENLRRVREADGGAVLLVDAGDMFQGTLESNLVEGASVVRAYNALEYLASAVGNHEFDFGPSGDDTTPQEEGADARGALKERAAEAAFPLLTANLLDAQSGERVDWHPNMPATVLRDAAAVRVGFVGVTSDDTLGTTIAANVSDLRVRPLAETIAEHATRLRREGASVIVVSAHAGGHCHDFSDPDDLDECEDEEIFDVAEALPAGLVDVIVAGHTHQAVAHRVNGIAIVESYSYGRAFGRVDLSVDRSAERVVDVRIHPPYVMCGDLSVGATDCEPGEYEGAPVTPVGTVEEVVARDVAVAQEQRDRPLGVRVEQALPSERSVESALGNLVCDLMLAAREGDVAIMNGGGLRAPLPAGELSYGEFHRMFPFDNRFARLRLTGAELTELFRRNLRSDGGIFTVGGMRVRARCRDGELEVQLRRHPGGRRIRPSEEVVVVLSDYLATTPNAVFTAAREAGRLEIEGGRPMREDLIELLARRGSVRADDPALNGRLDLPGERPLRCD